MRLVGAAALVVALALVVGCGSDGQKPTEVVLVTHDSFAVSKDVKRSLERELGVPLRILQGGDAAAMTNKALLTAGKPQGDVIFGIDDNLVSRVEAGELLDEHTPDAAGSLDPAYRVVAGKLTPIDHGEVCLNYDRGWFETHGVGRGVAPPATLADLAKPAYRGLLVVEDPATSSPGLAFLLATVARYGDGWQQYWRRLRENGVLVVDGWEEAYTQEFSGAAGSKGKRPIVVSYATSPAAEVIFAGRPLAESPTAAVEDGCYRQIEYAGVLRGAHNPDGARKLIELMLSERFQEDVPSSMFVYPVRAGVRLPTAFLKHAIVPKAPLQLPSDEVAANRDAWIREWTDIVVR
ncbi:MAG: thiamine ABC transporter substrate-binding protein [Gaiellales bacterium]